MKTFRYAWLPLVIATTYGTAAHAVEDDRIYIAPMGSYAIADKDRLNSDDGIGGTLAIGFPMTEAFALEVRGSYLDYGRRDFCDRNLLGLGVTCETKKDTVWGAGAGVNWYLAGTTMGPYLHADVMGGEHTQYNAGLGWDIPLFDFASIRAEALWHIEKPKDENDVSSDFHEALFNLGVRIPLGAKKAAPPPPPPPPVAVVPAPPPPPVCSDGIDNDGDGAIDFPADKGCTDANDMDEYNPICKAPGPGEPMTLEGCAVGDTIVLQGVTFEFDKARLTPNAKIILDGVAGALEKRPDIKVEIGGHTDSKGSDAYNLSLSDKRSKSVKDYLVSKGIATGRMTTRGYGESMPVADNNTDEGRELNRRVELKVTESTGGGVTVAPTVATAEFSKPMDTMPAAESSPAPAPAPVAAASGTTVVLKDYAYSPASITVPVGTTVTWKNEDGSNHFVNFAGESSGRMKEGASYTKTFTSPGVYEYTCQLHPQMKGTVVVQ